MKDIKEAVSHIVIMQVLVFAVLVDRWAGQE